MYPVACSRADLLCSVLGGHSSNPLSLWQGWSCSGSALGGHCPKMLLHRLLELGWSCSGSALGGHCPKMLLRRVLELGWSCSGSALGGHCPKMLFCFRYWS